MPQDADLSVLTHLQNDIFGLGQNYGKQLDTSFYRLQKVLGNSTDEFAPGYTFHTLHAKLDEYDTYIRRGKRMNVLPSSQPQEAVAEDKPSQAAAPSAPEAALQGMLLLLDNNFCSLIFLVLRRGPAYSYS